MGGVKKWYWKQDATNWLKDESRSSLPKFLKREESEPMEEALENATEQEEGPLEKIRSNWGRRVRKTIRWWWMRWVIRSSLSLWLLNIHAILIEGTQLLSDIVDFKMDGNENIIPMRWRRIRRRRIVSINKCRSVMSGLVAFWEKEQDGVVEEHSEPW